MLGAHWASVPGVRVRGAPSLRDTLEGSWRPSPLCLAGEAAGLSCPRGPPRRGLRPLPLAPGPAWPEERWPRGQGASACRAPAPRCRDSRVLQWGRVASLAKTIFSRVYLTAQTSRLSWGRKCSSAGSAAGFPAEPQRWPEAPCPRPGAGGSVHGRALTSVEEGLGTRGVARAHASLGPRPGAGGARGAVSLSPAAPPPPLGPRTPGGLPTVALGFQ